MTSRVLNMREGRAGVPSLIVCPRCEGQAYDHGSCGLCGNCGYLLDEDASRLTYADMVQILSTFALATGISLAPPAAVEPGQEERAGARDEDMMNEWGET